LGSLLIGNYYEKLPLIILLFQRPQLLLVNDFNGHDLRSLIKTSWYYIINNLNVENVLICLFGGEMNMSFGLKGIKRINIEEYS
jgi:hypothetical protein